MRLGRNRIQKGNENTMNVITSTNTFATYENAVKKLDKELGDNRVRIFFPGKPAADVRDRLKRNGFRWAPSLECWQAYRNHSALELAKQIGGAA